MKSFSLTLLVVLVGCNSGSKSAVVTPGEALFKQRCALCHSTGTQNGQGPGLAGIVGRKAASAPGFQYTKAIRESGLAFDEATLDKFLASPFTVVRGTTMTVATPDAGERKALIEYLASLGGAPKAAIAMPRETAVASGAAEEK